MEKQLIEFKFLEEANQWENLCRSYLACTSFVDSQVGRVLAALKKSGKADNTIVVLWSDHGWHLGEKLITGKNTLWDDGTRVPLIFAGPGIASEGRCTKPADSKTQMPIESGRPSRLTTRATTVSAAKTGGTSPTLTEPKNCTTCEKIPTSGRILPGIQSMPTSSLSTANGFPRLTASPLQAAAIEC